MQSNTHILVIRLSAMGDVAMTVPVIRAFVAQHPSVKITFLSKAFLKPLFIDIPNVSFYAADVEDTHKGVIGLHKLYKELKQLQITHIADFHNVLRSKVLRSFFRFSNRNISVIDKGRAEKKALTRSENKIFKQLKTSHQRYADVFQKLGFTTDLTNPSNWTKPSLAPTVAQLIKCPKEKPWIGIAPFAAFNSKTYPIDLMKKVILTLSKEYTIFLFGGGHNEIETLTTIAAKSKNCLSVAGKLSLKNELNLIANLDCMLAMDSGNAHFSAMLETPTITLWGATHPFAGFAPFNQPTSYCILPDLVKYPKLPCSVYGNKILEGYEGVMRTITPQQITDKIHQVLQPNS